MKFWRVVTTARAHVDAVRLVSHARRCNRVDGDTDPEMPDGFIPDLENEDWS